MAPGSPGSSPLARGLREGLGILRRNMRIIPARAGFTAAAHPTRATTRDHPRSRGVYRSRAWTDPPPGGSSPLARGLPSGRSPNGGPTRIIPARAGFTRGRCYPSRSRRDHPRSRGVYTEEEMPSHWHRGSSPLARGLPGITQPTHCSEGIIPARAGFTGQSSGGHNTLGDHPRSRGVYTCGS